MRGSGWGSDDGGKGSDGGGGEGGGLSTTQLPSSSVAAESKLYATGLIHPGRKYKQSAGPWPTTFASVAKFLARLSMQPSTRSTHVPEMVASES